MVNPGVRTNDWMAWRRSAMSIIPPEIILPRWGTEATDRVRRREIGYAGGRSGTQAGDGVRRRRFGYTGTRAEVSGTRAEVRVRGAEREAMQTGVRVIRGAAGCVLCSGYPL